jgi:2-methylcitrate dehydratase PrpD
VPKGYPENPLTREELESKFQSLASLIFARNRVRDILMTVGFLERIENVRELSRLLVA